MTLWSAEIKELEILYTSVKGRFPELDKELGHLIKTDDENVVMLYSRRCLEIIITDLCECELRRPRKTEPLKGIIDKLHHEEKVPPHIITSMHGLNDLSTFGAHPKDFDPEQVRPVLNNLMTIIKWYNKYKNVRVIEETKPADKRIPPEPPSIKEDAEEERIEKAIPFKMTKRKLFSGTVIFAILIVAVVITYQKIFKGDRLEYYKSQGEISVVVMPFQNMTNDDSKDFWQGMIQDNLINSLSNSEEIKVRQTESVINLLHNNNLTNYASITPAIASNVSEKLDANVFVYGSINQIDTIIRLNAQLIDSETKEVFKSFQIDGTAENILYMTDSLSVIVNNFLVITILKKQVSPAFHNFLGSTKSPEALNYFIDAQNIFWQRNYREAIELLQHAIEVDSNYIAPIMVIAVAYGNQGLYEDARKWSLKAYEKRDRMTRGERIMADYIYAINFGTRFEAIEYLQEMLTVDDQHSRIYFNLGFSYSTIHQFDKAIPELEKSLEIINKWGIKPYFISYYTVLGDAYHKTGQYKKEKKLYRKAEQDFPDDYSLLYRQAILALTEENTKEANRYIEKFISVRMIDAVSEATITTSLAGIYDEANLYDKAETYYREALLLEPDNPSRMNNLAYFLIGKDQNINEGLELADKALELSPDHYNYLDTKGWGLYKQGKYQEAVEILQRSWDLRRENARYNHEAFLHLEAAKGAVAGKKKDGEK
jgi:tetratricopeptide (TPR) repeat protein